MALMIQVKMTEVSSRLGNFTIIKMGQTVLISPCDTRMKILAALANGELTSDERSPRRQGRPIRA